MNDSKTLSFKQYSDLVKKDPSKIREVPDDVMLQLVKERCELLNLLTDEQLGKIESIIPDLNLEILEKNIDQRVLEFILFKWPKKTFDYLCNIRNKIRLLKPLLRLQVEPDAILVTKYGHDWRTLFSDEELKSIIMNLPVDLLEAVIKNTSIYDPNYSIMYIKKLPIEDIATLCQKTKKVYEKLDKDTQENVDVVLAGNDIGKIMHLSDSAKLKLCKKNKKYLALAESHIRQKYYEGEKTLTLDEVRRFETVSYYILDSMQEEDALNLAKADYEFLISLSPKKIIMWVEKKLSKIENPTKRQALIDMLHSLTDKPAFNSTATPHTELCQFSKILFDERITSKNSVELLNRYRQTFSRKILIQLLSNAYGNHVRDIFNERPELNLLDLDSFAMFDKDIYDVMGKGFVHYCITYNTGTFDQIVEEMSRDKNVLHNFHDYYECVTSHVYNLDINTIDIIFERYKLFKHVFMDINFNELNEEQINNLLLFINDPLIASINVETINDLNNYKEIRQRSFKEYIQSLKGPDDIRNAIYEYITNVDYLFLGEHSQLDRLPLDSFLNVFDIDNIVNNEELIIEIGLSNDEVSLLLLLNEINKIHNTDVLKDTFMSLLDKQLDSLACRNTINKMRKYYTENVKQNLTGKAALEQMKSQKMDNGVEVVQFTGQDFRFLVSYTGVNLSFSYALPYALTGKRLLDSWTGMENGLNFISTTLVSSNTNIHPCSDEAAKELEGHIIFVFDQNVDIIGMGSTDISASHFTKSRTHTFKFVGDKFHDHKFSTIDKLEEKTKNRTKDDGKFKNEVAIARYHEDLRQENAMKRVMPIGIYVVGEITKKQMETARVFNEYYKAHGLGTFRIIQVDPLKYGYNPYRQEAKVNAGKSR